MYKVRFTLRRDLIFRISSHRAAQNLISPATTTAMTSPTMIVRTIIHKKGVDSAGIEVGRKHHILLMTITITTTLLHGCGYISVYTNWKMIICTYICTRTGSPLSLFTTAYVVIAIAL